jgi:hypothetical protein
MPATDLFGASVPGEGPPIPAWFRVLRATVVLVGGLLIACVVAGLAGRTL